jgi:hypothetical protein
LALPKALVGDRVMEKVKVPIDPSDFTAIPRMMEILKTLPKEILSCPGHGIDVTIELGPVLANQGGGVPFTDAHWVGCCVESINRVKQAVQQKSQELISRAKETYRDHLARELEPEHFGEIVAIELLTGEHSVGKDELEAADKARAAGHNGLLYFLRVGSPYAHRLRSPRQ